MVDQYSHCVQLYVDQDLHGIHHCTQYFDQRSWWTSDSHCVHCTVDVVSFGIHHCTQYFDQRSWWTSTVIAYNCTLCHTLESTIVRSTLIVETIMVDQYSHCVQLYVVSYIGIHHCTQYFDQRSWWTSTVIAYNCTLCHTLESTIVRSTLINDQQYSLRTMTYHLESTMYQSSTINSTVCVQ